VKYLVLIPILSCVAYFVLLARSIKELNKPGNKIFTLFLSISLAWSLCSFFLFFKFSPSSEYRIFWEELIVIAVVCSFASFYHLINTYFDRPVRVLTYCVYVGILVVLGVSFTINLTGISIFENLTSYGVGPWVLVMVAILIPIVVISLKTLIKKYRVLKDPVERNKISYFVVGLSIATVYALMSPALMVSTYLPLDHLGNLANAIIISLIIRKYELPELGLVFRRILTYSLLTLIVAGVYSA